MKAAVLCNGPSRVAFQSPLEYNYVIGCNIPWTEVDSTIILDIEVVRRICKQPELIKSKIYFSTNSWRSMPHKCRDIFKSQFVDLVDQWQGHYSSGHAACRKVIELGYKEIDIYGCDSRFTGSTDSHTHQWIDNRPVDIIKQVKGWNVYWEKIISTHKDVTIKFIGEPK